MSANLSAPAAGDEPPRRRRVNPAGLRPAEASAFIGVGLSTLGKLDRSGKVPKPRRIGKAVIWCRAELAEWMRRDCPPRREWQPLWAELNNRRARRA